MRLHAFLDLLDLDRVAQHLQQVDDGHILVGRLLQGVLHPFVGLAADVDKQIAGGYFQNIRRRGLVAVQIHTAVQEHGQLRVGGVVAEDIFHPVVFGKDGGNDLQPVRIRRLRGAAACEAAQQDRGRKEDGKYFFHNETSVHIVFWHKKARETVQNGRTAPLGRFL